MYPCDLLFIQVVLVLALETIIHGLSGRATAHRIICTISRVIVAC